MSTLRTPQGRKTSPAVATLRRGGWEDALPNALWRMLSGICWSSERGEQLRDAGLWSWVNYAADEPRCWGGGRPLFQAGRWPANEPRRGDPDLRRDTFRSLLSLDESDPLETLDDGLAWLQDHGLVKFESGFLPAEHATYAVREVFDVAPPREDELYAWLTCDAIEDLALLDLTSNELTHEALVETLASGAVHNLWSPSTPAMQVSAMWPFRLNPFGDISRADLAHKRPTH